MRDPNDPIDKRLGETFLQCVTGAKPLQFSADKLFAKWFQDQGKPYFFLFRKNLSRTNIQFAELVSLIRLHTNQNNVGHPKADLQFVMVSEFLGGIQRVVDDLLKSKPSKSVLCDAFLDLYSALRHTILIQVLHGSCSVYLPPHMTLDMLKVCQEAGYIHSCGRSVYSCDLNCASDTDFKRTLSSYLDKISNGTPVFFVVYSHEDFSRHDRDYASELRGGLDDVKIYAEKYFIGNKPLVRVLQELKEENDKTVFIAQPGPYTQHKEQRETTELVPGKSIMLIIDRAVSNHRGHPSDQQILICYDQEFKNQSPLPIFEENKPAWIAHTTIPHTLAAAMVNITRPIWPRDAVQLYDPFSGTGTIALEALKFHNVQINCNDASPLAKTLLFDNLEFFAKPIDDLEQIGKDLKALEEPDCNEYDVPPLRKIPPSPYRTAMSIFNELPSADDDGNNEWFDIPEKIAEKLNKQSFAVRFRFYIALRTKLRHAAAFDRKAAWLNSYREEVKTLRFQTKRLISLRRATKVGGILTEGTYSQGCTINPKLFLSRNKVHDRIKFTNGDAAVNRPPLVDLVITDPPYGFNNEIGTVQLAKLLTRTLDVVLSRMKPLAQLVIAVPDYSHSGRRIPLFATRVWVTIQVIALAELQGFETVVPARIAPGLNNILEPPFYWTSEKALTRSILHFQFRKKKTLGKESRKHKLLRN